MLEKLSEAQRVYIQQQIEQGIFANEWEAMDDAIRRSREDDAKKIAKIHALIAEAEASLARGEGIPYTEDFMDKVCEQAMEDFKNGKPISDHVKP